MSTRKPDASKLPSLPPAQTCDRCGAVFRWEPSEPGVKNAPLAATLAKPSDKCDCGYGARAPLFEQ